MAQVTIEDVAREAGVSIATVSRFTNGQHGFMSARTRDRLQEIVARLGYVPNPAAQTLKTGRSKLIGVVLANIAHPYWSSVLAGVEEACQALGYSLLISSAGDSPKLEGHYLRLFLNQKVAGVLLNPASADPKTVAKWASLACPVVTLDRTLPGLNRDLVAMDNVHGARLAIDHLLALGHRRIGMVSWPVENLSNRQERVQGYTEVIQSVGLEVDPDDIRFAKDTSDGGVSETVALFTQRDPPTAVFSANSMLNLQVLAGLKQLGLRVPQDVSVVGYDESPWDPLLDPPLTTVATPAHQLGVTAARHLCQVIQGSDEPRAREIRLKPRLIVRSSTAPLVPRP